MHYLNEDGIIQKQDNGLYSITNLGAILFAKDLNEFARLGRKAMRVVKYKGVNRLLIQKEEPFSQGYAICFYCCPIKLQYSNKVWLERLIFSVRVFFFILQAPP